MISPQATIGTVKCITTFRIFKYPAHSAKAEASSLLLRTFSPFISRSFCGISFVKLVSLEVQPGHRALTIAGFNDISRLWARWFTWRYGKPRMIRLSGASV